MRSPSCMKSEAQVRVEEGENLRIEYPFATAKLDVFGVFPSLNQEQRETRPSGNYLLIDPGVNFVYASDKFI
jgi:hypothetical protein